MSASIGRVLVTRELLGTKNKITNQLLVVLMSLGVSDIRSLLRILDIHSLTLWLKRLWFISWKIKNLDIHGVPGDQDFKSSVHHAPQIGDIKVSSWIRRVLRNPWQMNILEEEKHIFIEESASQPEIRTKGAWSKADDSQIIWMIAKNTNLFQTYLAGVLTFGKKRPFHIFMPQIAESPKRKPIPPCVEIPSTPE